MSPLIYLLGRKTHYEPPDIFTGSEEWIGNINGQLGHKTLGLSAWFCVIDKPVVCSSLSPLHCSSLSLPSSSSQALRKGVIVCFAGSTHLRFRHSPLRQSTAVGGFSTAVEEVVGARTVADVT